MDDRAQLVKEVKKLEQQNGVLEHKLKLKKEDKNKYNVIVGKLRKEKDQHRDDLKLAYKNMEEQYRTIIALKRAFKVLTLTGDEKQQFEQALAK